MNEALSQAEYARHRGLSRFCVTNWKKKGLLAFAPDGRVDVAASEALLANRPLVYRGGVTNRAPGRGKHVTSELQFRKTKSNPRVTFEKTKCEPW